MNLSQTRKAMTGWGLMMIISDLCPNWAQGKEVKQFGKFRNPIGAGANGYCSY